MKKIISSLVFVIAFTFLIIHGSESVFATQSTDELVVSAVNPATGNSFSGPQVVEVIVKDPTLQSTNQIQTEPSVTIGNIPLRMAQATDGYWYAFFADARFAQIADKTQYISSSMPSTGKGLDFGEFCSPASAINATGVDFSQTRGVAIAQSAPGASNGYTSGSTSYTITSTCIGSADGATKNISGGSVLNHVIRHPPSLNMMSGIPGGKVGQIGINPNAWPVIQLISNPTPIVYANTAVVNLNTGNPTRQLLAEIDKAS
ncbi:MAG: hypothetical protein KGI28_10015, partial [Thaumarchaeota archaeon]|nr:hypothetical protein [Nitrososphaerota archaeon]